MPLKKELNLLTLTLYGVGIILGAGIYALVGTAAGLAENMLWLPFVLASLLAVFTGLSYAELSGIFQKEAAEYAYTKTAFKKEWLAFMTDWLLVVAGVVSAAVVALAFGGYLSHLVGGSTTIYAMLLIALMSAINYIGIRESSSYNNISSIIEAGGLILVIIIGLFFGSPETVGTDLLQPPSTGLTGIFTAVGIIFFAFVGFEYMANVSEEVKSARKIVPKAIILALAISSLLYILLSISILNLASWQELAASPAPLTTAVAKVIPDFGLAISIIALFATSNTVLIILVGSSRILYGLSRQGSLPSICSVLSSRGTPYASVAAVAIVAVLSTAYGDIKSIAQLTDLGVFIVYLLVNISLIKLRSSGFRSLHNSFRGPDLSGVPILPVLGAITSIFMMFYFDIHVWAAQIAIVLLGFVVFEAYKSSSKRTAKKAIMHVVKR